MCMDDFTCVPSCTNGAIQGTALDSKHKSQDVLLLTCTTDVGCVSQPGHTLDVLVDSSGHALGKWTGSIS